jgi:hypothetical protein
LNRGEIKKRILDGINDDADSSVFFTDAQLNSLIDEASEFVVAETRGIRRSTFLALRDSTTFYSLRSLASDILLPYRIWNYENSSRLTVTSMEELDQFQQRWLDTAAPPEMWFSVSWDIIGIFPRPTSSGGVLRVDYFAWPEALSDDTSVPESTTQDAIVLYGTYMGLLKQWDTQRAAEAFKRLQKNTIFDKAKSGILRVGHRSFGRSNLDLPNSIRSELP